MANLFWYLLGAISGFVLTIIIAMISAYKQFKFEKTLQFKTINDLSKVKKGK